MDQDSFRLLLNSSKPSPSERNVKQSKAYNRGSLLASGSSTKPAEPVQADFKPRKVKKTADSKYRDRAAERRGGANEYAEVEGLLEEFEKRMVGEDREIVDEQRKYLGGDATHTVLVKGLDFALLEQQRAREESRDDLDDDLESAFQGKPVEPASIEEVSASTQTQGKKRTRAELLAELRQSRDTNATQETKASTKEEEIEALERAKQAGKFKPMGSSSFAPVEKKKKKKKKVTSEQEQPEVKATKANLPHVKESVVPPSTAAVPAKTADAAQDAESKPKASPSTDNSAPTPVPAAPAAPAEDIEEADPFGDVGEYEPDYGDDSDTETKPKDTLQPSAAPGRRNWFNDPDPEPEPVKPATPPPVVSEENEPEAGPSQARLESLMSSAMPSISDFLAADKEEEARERKKARKEKNKKKAT
ncbi:hypothetical protein RSOLAG1IB_04669 [Rhizoctonia solani AG-1 IB]|uniref:RED-like N-terminal domain-containing protein n=1 Tax=Thanatephorus cucumeris (strain AG1-IB / isolate 7/3/14) TaxID=1108050 RepID=A0A0B7FYH7_THACB|nr:hypothetical protein RSOLAG1IB_04669 [Rhizoctonia solani AG-1 IB]